MRCPKNWVPGTFEKLEVLLCSELAGDSGNAIKNFSSDLKNFILPEGSLVHGMPKKLGPGNF
jgi:hypothetical protein